MTKASMVFDEIPSILWFPNSPLFSKSPSRRLLYLTAFIPLVRRQRDYIVLPLHIPEVVEFWEYWKDTFDLDDNQALWLPLSGAFQQKEFEDYGFEKAGTFFKKEKENTDVRCVPLVANENARLQAAVNGIPLISSSSDWIAQFPDGVGTILRAVSSLETPSSLEIMESQLEGFPKFDVPEGFLCSNMKELLMAHRHLQAGPFAITPTEFPESDENVIVYNVEEMRMYDFAHGSVYVRELIALDRAEDGITSRPVHCSFLGNILLPGTFDRVELNNNLIGWRPPKEAKEFKKVIESMSTAVSDLLPQTTFTLRYISVNAKPKLIHFACDKISFDQIIAMFLTIHPDIARAIETKKVLWNVWRLSSHADLDIRMMHQRLAREGLTYQLNLSQKGSVGELKVPKDGLAIPIAFARSHVNHFLLLVPLSEDEKKASEQLTSLRFRLNDIITKPPSIGPLPFATLDHDTIIYTRLPLSSHPSDVQRLLIPLATTCLLRHKTDYIVLPRTEAIQAYWDFAREFFDFDESQVIWAHTGNSNISTLTEDNMIGSGLQTTKILERLKEIGMSVPAPKTLVPYFPTENFNTFVQPLKTFGYNLYSEDENEHIIHTPTGHLLVNSRDPSKPTVPSVTESVAAAFHLQSKCTHVIVSPTFLCTSPDEVSAAVDYLNENVPGEYEPPILMRPIYSTTEGISEVILSDAHAIQLVGLPHSAVNISEAFASSDEQPLPRTFFASSSKSSTDLLAPTKHSSFGNLDAKVMESILEHEGVRTRWLLSYTNGVLDDVLSPLLLTFVNGRPVSLSQPFEIPSSIEDLLKEAKEYCARLLGSFKSRSSGTFWFEISAFSEHENKKYGAMSVGTPVIRLIESRVGIYDLWYVAAQIIRSQTPYSPSKNLSVWMSNAYAGCGGTQIWRLWEKLKNDNIAFEMDIRKGDSVLSPHASSGVFPISYVADKESTIGIFFIVSKDEEEADFFRRSVSKMLQESRVPLMLRPSPFHRRDLSKESFRRIWEFDPSVSEAGQSRQDLIFLPAMLLRPGKDIAILPKSLVSDNACMEWWDFCRSILGLEDTQAQWLSGLSDKEVAQKMNELIKTQASRYTLVPYKAEQASGWTNLVSRDIHLFSETPEWLSANAGPRHPMVVREELDDEAGGVSEGRLHRVCRNHGVRVVPMKHCHTAQEVHLAAKEMGLPVIVIMPSGELFSIKSRAEIGFLILPKDGVYVTKKLFPDYLEEEDFPMLHTVFFSGQSIHEKVFDKLMIGSKEMGIRSSRLDEASQKRLLSLSSDLVRALRPSGPGEITFATCKGEFFITNVTANVLSPFSCASLFGERHAADAQVLLSWVIEDLPVDLDVWTLWQRMLERDIALIPGASKTGIIPLTYMKSSRAGFMAFGSSEEHIVKMRALFDECLEESLENVETERVSITNTSLRRIWVHGPYVPNSPPYTRIKYGSRPMCLLRTDLDVIILPGKSEEVFDFWELNRLIKGLSKDQAIFTPGDNHLIDEDVSMDIVSKLKGIVTSSPEGPSGWVIIPYKITTKFFEWAGPLLAMGVRYTGEDEEWLEKFGDKSILHRWIKDLETPSVIENLGVGKIPIPKGYNARNTEELLEAYERLGVEKTVIKPHSGADGRGIVFVKAKDQLQLYNFPMGPVILEEWLDLDRAPDGVVLSPAVHYVEHAIYGKGLVDQLMVGTSYNGWRTSVVEPGFTRTCIKVCERLISHMKPKGVGGFDFLSQDGLPYLSDVNTGRFNGAHYPKFFLSLYAPEANWVVWMWHPPTELTPAVMWARLVRAGVAFWPGKSTSGVYPLVHLAGHLGMYIAVSSEKTEMATHILRSKAEDALNKPVEEDERVGAQAILMEPPVRIDSGPHLIEEPISTGLSLLLHPAAVYAPQPITDCEAVLVGGGKMLGLLSKTQAEILKPMCSTVFDLEGQILCPGLIDVHVHLSGGGGEYGPASRIHEASFEELVNGGLTTVFGILGTDSVTRTPQNLLMKVKSINSAGLTAYMYSGAYQFPPPTLHGSPSKDMCLHHEIMGVGELALSDHRGSYPTTQQLLSLLRDIKLGTMVSGRQGALHVHLGKEKERLEPLRKVVAHDPSLRRMILPTHCGRTQELVDEVKAWVREGGWADFTSAQPGSLKALVDFKNEDPELLRRITVTSDAFGSLPVFDSHGNLVCVNTAKPTLLHLMKDLYFRYHWSLKDILPLMTANPAAFYKLSHKGYIGVGADADLIALDENTLALTHVFAKGVAVKTPEFTHRGGPNVDPMPME